MEVLDSVKIGVELVQSAFDLFQKGYSESAEFVKPFIMYRGKRHTLKTEDLEEFSEACVQQKLRIPSVLPGCFVLAGETEIQDPKSNEVKHFFVIKLYLQNMEEGYVYSVPFIPASVDKPVQISPLKFVGSEANGFLPFETPEGESSSCNVIKMDPKPPYDNRAAFLIGHVDEERLWRDLQTFISDMYCKLAPDFSRLYELVFEVSKFGKMTKEMQLEFDKFQSYFEKEFVPQFKNIRSSVVLENTRLA